LRLKELEGLQETQLQKFLAFQAQYKSMTSKLDLAVNDLILVLKDYGITLPDSG